MSTGTPAIDGTEQHGLQDDNIHPVEVITGAGAGVQQDGENNAQLNARLLPRDREDSSSGDGSVHGSAHESDTGRTAARPRDTYTGRNDGARQRTGNRNGNWNEYRHGNRNGQQPNGGPYYYPPPMVPYMPMSHPYDSHMYTHNTTQYNRNAQSSYNLPPPNQRPPSSFSQQGQQNPRFPTPHSPVSVSINHGSPLVIS